MAGPTGGAVLVKSTSDPAGLVIAVTETGPSTGIFTATISFTTGTSVGNTLQVAEGDTITAMYRDWTPAGLTPGFLGVMTEDVTTTAIVGAPVPDLPIISGTPELQDANGNPVTSAAHGTQVLLASELTNAATTTVTMLYIVQVKDSAGTVVLLNYIMGAVPGSASFTFAVSWIPEKAGTYTVEVYAWTSWADPTPLSAVSTSTVTIT
jgi:hypothetical protein